MAAQDLVRPAHREREGAIVSMIPYSYLEEQTRFLRAKEWDQKEELLMQAFRNKRQELLMRDRALKEL